MEQDFDIAPAHDLCIERLIIGETLLPDHSFRQFNRLWIEKLMATIEKHMAMD